MLILQNLNVQAAKKSFSNNTQKFIKISINQHIATSKQPAKVKSSTNIQWAEPIPLPLFINAKYRFEIFQKHSFGYNPQELAIIGGTIIVGEEDSFNNWEILTDKNQKYGLLSANIRKKIKYSPNLSTLPPEPQIVTINSIIAHTTALTQKRAYIKLKINGKSLDTDMAKSKAGQLLFTQQIQIQKSDQVLSAQVQLYGFDAKDQKSQLIATGKLIFNPQQLQKRVIFKNLKGIQVGDAFIDHKIMPKKDYNINKQISKILQKSSLLGRINQNDKFSSRSIENDYSQYTKLNRSLINESINHSRKVSHQRKKSIVNQNQNIIIPKEKRFVYYNDNQNRNISHLKEDQRDFDFLEKHSKNYYKGASIGKGNKIDFTAQVRSNPGVGVQFTKYLGQILKLSLKIHFDFYYIIQQTAISSYLKQYQRLVLLNQFIQIYLQNGRYKQIEDKRQYYLLTLYIKKIKTDNENQYFFCLSNQEKVF